MKVGDRVRTIVRDIEYISFSAPKVYCNKVYIVQSAYKHTDGRRYIIFDTGEICWECNLEVVSDKTIIGGELV